jgi:hypothetical protein
MRHHPCGLIVRRWLEHLTGADRPQARKRARELALKHGDAVTVATLLLELDDPAGAEEAFLQADAAIDGRNYGQLVPLAKALRQQECPRGETAVLHALMADIMGRANARAYGHAARYLGRLREIAATGGRLGPLGRCTRSSSRSPRRCFHGKWPSGRRLLVSATRGRQTSRPS